MGQSLRMLCVDDNAQLREELREQFLAEDFTVDTAGDGDVAVEMIRKTTYDVVLLDLKMPRMDGRAVLQELRKINRVPPVIMLTAVDDLPTALECVRLGARDYISKPYDPAELLHVVIKVLGS